MLEEEATQSPWRVLILDGDAVHASRVRQRLMELEPELRVGVVGRLRQAVEALAQPGIWCVVTELQLPDAEGIPVVRTLRQVAPEIPLVVMTTIDQAEVAVAAIRRGAADYMIKGPDCSVRLAAIVREAIGRAVYSALDETAEGDPLPRSGATIEGFVATTTVMRRVLALVDRAANSAVPVLLEGETGTGKEVLARAIHDRGRRRSAPFLVQNCAALAESLLESELFGHVRGAFTGAERDRRGLFDEAGDGTVFLDEIGDAPLSVQAKLLRVLQNAEVKPVGADRPHRIRARIVAATNRSLAAEVRAGRFRKDLFFRLSAFQLSIPPLRHRTADVPPIVELALRRFENEEGRQIAGVSPQALRLLKSYRWPGNVRELEHEIHRLVLTVPAGEHIRPRDLPARIRHVSGDPMDAPLALTMGRLELAVIQDRLRRYPSKTAAARSLGITREALYAKLRRLGRIGVLADEAVEGRPAVTSG